MSENQPALFPETAGTTGPGSIEVAAGESIDALRKYGAIDATHSLKIELIMSGARSLDREMQRGKITVAATAMFSKVVDIADGLPTVQQAVDDRFAKLAAALADVD